VKLETRALVLMSVWLGACGGDDQPPPLADFDAPERTGSSSTSGAGGGGSSIPTPSETGGAGTGNPASGTGGANSYIPTPTETGSMNVAGQGGAGTGTGPTPPTETCSQGTWTGNFSARSAADLQQLVGYTHVTGTLYVGTSASASGTDVTSLLALSCLEQVDGSLTLLENPVLIDLEGLEQLAFVGDDFTVSTNASLRSLEAVTQLVVGDVLHLRANPQLTLLGAGLLSATTLYINENAALPQCRADALANELGLLCNCAGNSESSCE
jgi:hypothetical protein